MIICFSGTGNSSFVARHLAAALGDEIVMIDRSFYDNPHYKGDVNHNRIIWVFPIYSWGVPPVVMSVIRRITGIPDHTCNWMVATCGDDAGYADKMWRHAIKTRGMTPMGAYTVFMPNTYVCMKGFDIDNPKLALSKEENTLDRLPAIVDRIRSNDTDADIKRGWLPLVKTVAIYPWFVRKMMNPSGFHTTNQCTGCGTCARECPLSNIEIVNHRPQWSTTCAFCLRCYHRCPSNAIQWEKATDGKGQYPGPANIDTLINTRQS